MNMKYFTREYNSIDEIKKEFRTLSKKYHPDMGGTDKQFRELYSEYEYLLKNWVKREYKDAELSDKIKAIIDELIMYDNLDLEVIGKWLWVTTTTREHNQILKDLEFLWSSKHKKWYYNGSTKKVMKASKYSLQDMKTMMGSKHIEKKREERLTIG